MTKRLVTPLLAVAAALSLIFALTACSSSKDTNKSAGTNTSGMTVKVVASTALWADVAKQVANNSDLVDITGLIEGDSVDPHDYTPSSKDMAAVSDADIIIGNGAGYDNWLTEKAPDSATVITALPQEEDEHDHDHGDAHESEAADAHDHESEAASATDSGLPTNPHVWYDVKTVKQFAETIATVLNSKNSEIGASADSFNSEMDKINDRIQKLPAKKVAGTESVSGYLLAESPMTDVTPHGYLESSLKESDPSAADVAEFTDLIKNKGIDILVYNPQTEDSVSEDLKKAADDAGIPVVDVYETPEKNQSYLDFVSQAVSNLEKAAN